jgi:peptidoglycan hydrolase-like protein with peptidoglycan-binding domain
MLSAKSAKAIRTMLNMVTIMSLCIVPAHAQSAKAPVRQEGVAAKCPPHCASVPSARVKEGQELLSTAGQDPGEPDGLLGPKTKSAIEQFQRAQGLGVTGSFDNQTFQSLKAVQGTAPGPLK